MHNRHYLLLLFSFIFLLLPCLAYSQDQGKNIDTIAGIFTLDQCIQYAANHQPAIKQSQLDEKIARANNMIGLSGWLPQAGFSGTLQHYYDLPTAFFANQSNPNGPKQATHTGLYNTFNPQLNVTQNIFNSDVLYAANAAHLYTEQAQENSSATKIALVSNVSKAFYDVLLTQQQLYVLQEDTARLIKNKEFTYNEYVSGIVDKVDYKQATIALNNTLAQLKTTQESLNPKYAVLKQLMGFPQEKYIQVNFDTTQMLQEITFDTTEILNYSKRIEYQQLETSQRLQAKLTNYYRYGFIPSVGAFYNYTWQYQNDQYTDLYSQPYPYSYIGLNFTFPLFQGFKRLENVHKAKLLERRQDWDMINLKLQINTEYKQALANYKSNMYNLYTMEENKQLAREVYDIVQLQYKEGIKNYLNVITAETDLRTSEINYLNALFQLLLSKIDLQKAMGDISTNIN